MYNNKVVLSLTFIALPYPEEGKLDVNKERNVIYYFLLSFQIKDLLKPDVMQDVAMATVQLMNE